MAKVVCPPGVWTAIPDTGGDMLLSTAAGGVWVCTDGTDPDPVEGYSLGATQAMVISAGTPVSVYPASILGTVVEANPA